MIILSFGGFCRVNRSQSIRSFKIQTNLKTKVKNMIWRVIWFLKFTFRKNNKTNDVRSKNWKVILASFIHDIFDDMVSLLGNSGTWGGFDEAFSLLAKFKIWTRICIYMELAFCHFFVLCICLLQVFWYKHKQHIELFHYDFRIYKFSFDGIHKS